MSIEKGKRRDSRVKTGIVLVCPDGEFIEDTDGDWGPRYHSRSRLRDATVFDRGELAEVKRQWGGSLFEQKVRVTEIIEEV